jgi:hypothetical protein
MDHVDRVSRLLEFFVAILDVLTLFVIRVVVLRYRFIKHELQLLLDKWSCNNVLDTFQWLGM